jgi:hypothetical protein
MREGTIVTDVAAVTAPLVSATSTAVRESASFDERWAAWQAKGAAHDRAVRRKVAVASPILLFAAAVAMYLFLGR